MGFNDFIGKLFGNKNTRDMREIQPWVEKAKKAYIAIEMLTADELRAKTKELQERNGGYIKTMWCGELECELKMKEVAGMSSRCIPFAQENLGDTCPCCGKPASKMVYWGVAY